MPLFERLRKARGAREEKRRKMQAFLKDYDRFTAMAEGSRRRLPLRWEDRYPVLDDKTAETGFDRHYIYHPAWAARVLAATRPPRHVDISSTLYFCSLISAFLPVDFYDFRPPLLRLPGLGVGAADLTQLTFASDSIPSLSCMHVIEHAGLGRYGDPLDPEGDLKAVAELTRVLAPGGNLLVAVPVGRERICYNAHRIYNYRRFAGYFAGLTLREFSLIPDGPAPDGMLLDPDPALVDQQEYACGCYWFTK